MSKPLRFDYVAGRFRNGAGQYISKARGLRSKIARAQYEQHLAATRAGIEALAAKPKRKRKKITRRPEPDFWNDPFDPFDTDKEYRNFWFPDEDETSDLLISESLEYGKPVQWGVDYFPERLDEADYYYYGEADEFWDDLGYDLDNLIEVDSL